MRYIRESASSPNQLLNLHKLPIWGAMTTGAVKGRWVLSKEDKGWKSANLWRAYAEFTFPFSMSTLLDYYAPRVGFANSGAKFYSDVEKTVDKFLAKVDKTDVIDAYAVLQDRNGSVLTPVDEDTMRIRIELNIELRRT